MSRTRDFTVKNFASLEGRRAGADCYSAGERRWMGRWQQLRESGLRPVLRCLTRWRITPDQLTFASLLIGLVACPLLVMSIPWALLCLLAHLLLDGLDGPLARYQGVASQKGSFTDTMADQLVVSVSTAALIIGGWASVAAGLAYVVTYGIVVVFAMVRNALAIPYSWLLRPRLWI